jgi:hypothetical protein
MLLVTGHSVLDELAAVMAMWLKLARWRAARQATDAAGGDVPCDRGGSWRLSVRQCTWQAGLCPANYFRDSVFCPLGLLHYILTVAAVSHSSPVQE